MKSRLFITTAWLLFAASLFSQGSISGMVVDVDTEEPLLFATVVLMENGIVVKGTTTDFDGKFEISGLAGGSYQLEARYVGYIAKKVTDIIVEEEKTKELRIKMNISEIPCCCFSPIRYEPPLMKIDDMSTGHTFLANDIRRLGKEQ